MTHLPLFYSFGVKSLGCTICCLLVGFFHVWKEKEKSPFKDFLQICYYEVECLARTKILIICIVTGFVIDLGIAFLILAQ